MIRSHLEADDASTDGLPSATASRRYPSSPECKGTAVRDHGHGETTCADCGPAIEPAAYEYVPRVASALDVGDAATRRAHDLLTLATARGAHRGKSPAGLAAAALYAAALLVNEPLTQERVSSVAHVSTVTIRHRYQELLDIHAEEEGNP